MRVSCPGCAAVYEVPDRLMAAPRPLRCHRCGRTWTPAPARVEAAPPADTAPPPGPDRLAPRPVARRPPPIAPARARPPRGLALAWVASVLVVAGGLACLVVFAADVVEAFPPAARLYLALGLEPASALSTSPAR